MLQVLKSHPFYAQMKKSLNFPSQVGFQYAHLHMQTTDLFEGWDEDLVHLGLRMLVMAGSTIFMLLRTTLGAYGANYPRLLQQDVEIK